MTTYIHHIMPTLKEAFLSQITRSDGRISPRSLKYNYFTKHNIVHLWDHFDRETKQFQAYSYSDRVFFYRNNITAVKPCKCCGNPCITINYTKGKQYSNYCSAKCAQSDSGPKLIGASKRDIPASNLTRKKTMMDKYGVEYNSQRPELKHIWTAPKVAPFIHTKLMDKAYLIEQYVTFKRTAKSIGDDLGCYYGTVIEYLKLHGIEISYIRSTSVLETEIKTYIESLGVIVEQSNRGMIAPKELDLYIASHNFAVEANGSYWHSYSMMETTLERNKHLLKYSMCQDVGISLLQITDLDWRNNTDIVKSMIANKLGHSIKLDARKLTIEKLTNAQYKEFVMNNHISGYARASKIYALCKGNEPIAMVSFAKSRFDHKVDWEVIRFCTKLGHTVRGGFSKLLKAFIKEMDPVSIGTYSDNRFGSGGVYLKAGFTHIRKVDPGYSWTDTAVMLNRYLCQKKKLPKLLGTKFDITKTEAENMWGSKYRRMWDAGHNYFVLQVK